MGKIHDTDKGTYIELDTDVDISSATTHVIKAQGPSGGILSYAATVVGTDVLRHVKTASTFNVPGRWKLEAFAILTDGSEYTGEAAFLEIYDSLKGQE